MPVLRKVVDEKHARACLAAIKKSREPLRDWVRRNQIDGRSLRAWELNLSRGSCAALTRTAPAKLVELVPVSRTGSARRYLIRIGVASVEVGDDFDAATLRRLVGVLRAC